MQKRLRKLLPDPFDLLLLVGLALIIGGVWGFSHPAALIVAGIALITLSVLAGRKPRSEAYRNWQQEREP